MLLLPLLGHFFPTLFYSARFGGTASRFICIYVFMGVCVCVCVFHSLSSVAWQGCTFVEGLHLVSLLQVFLYCCCCCCCCPSCTCAFVAPIAEWDAFVYVYFFLPRLFWTTGLVLSGPAFVVFFPSEKVMCPLQEKKMQCSNLFFFFSHIKEYEII